MKFMHSLAEVIVLWMIERRKLSCQKVYKKEFLWKQNNKN